MPLPFLTDFTDSIAIFLATNSSVPWDSKHLISKEIKTQLRKINILLDTGVGETFPTKRNQRVALSQQHPCVRGAEADICTGDTVQDFCRENSIFNCKKNASSNQHSWSRPGEIVSLSVDKSGNFIVPDEKGAEKTPSTNASTLFTRSPHGL